MYKRLVTVALLLAFALAPIFKATAAPNPTPITRVALAAAVTCQNADFVTGVGKDLVDLGDKFKNTDIKDVAATSNTFLAISGTRQKYEDMSVSNDCLDLQFETVLAFSNAADVLALALAGQTDTQNAAAYNRILPNQVSRFGQYTQNVLVLSGAATPAPDAPPAGRIGQITSTTCTDKDFLTGLSTDFNNFSKILTAADMKDAASISQSLLGLIALRQKYEDLKAPSGCEITQLTVIVTLANASDLLELGLAIKADAKSADIYAKALDGQSARTKQLIQRVATAAGVATPAATAAQ